MSPPLAVVLTVAVPLVVASVNPGATSQVAISNQAYGVLIALASLALWGYFGVVTTTDSSIRPAPVMAIPLVQAIWVVVVHRLFYRHFGRRPVNVAKNFTPGLCWDRALALATISALAPGFVLLALSRTA